MQQSYLNIEYIFYLIYTFITSGGASLDPNAFFASEFYTRLITLWGWYTLIATIVTLVLLTIFLYSYINLRRIRAEDEKFLNDAVIVSDDSGPQELTRWQKIEALFNEGGEANWRQAIIEADIMLDDMLTAQGYDGDSVGEKLKAIEPSDFNTLQYAWAAHKVRNQIAHEGQNFVLTEREARQAMHWFERVFDEFHFD
ncbi:MAG: hypothetical protein ACJKSS_00030 [Patescibacteria group bacterium UBA2103]